MLFGGIILMVFLILAKRPLIIRMRIFQILCVAGMAFAFDLFFWHRSIHLIGPGLATLLSGFQVFVLAVVGITVFGERLRWQLVVAIPAALVGVALIIGADWSGLGDGYLTGIVFGLATAVCYSTYLLIMRWARANAAIGVSPMAEVAWTSLACASVLAILATTTGESLVISTPHELMLLLGYALIAQIALAIISSSLYSVPASLVGLLLLLEPTFAYVWDLTLLGRDASRLETIGACISLFAIYFGSLRREV